MPYSLRNSLALEAGSVLAPVVDARKLIVIERRRVRQTRPAFPSHVGDAASPSFSEVLSLYVRMACLEVTVFP